MSVAPARLRARWHRARHRAANVPSRVHAAATGRGVTAYWFHDFANFGDLITPWLVRAYGYVPVNARAGEARLASTGSILQWLPTDYTGTVLGSGLALERPRPLPHARILAVRGARTRDLMGAPADVALGDPGLLAVHLSGVRAEPQVPIGLVPHYYDRGHDVFARLAAGLGRHCRVVDVRQSPAAVFASLAGCETVVTSSLHGLITADALGIPAVWSVVSDRVMGGEFKFLDHESALEVPRRQVALTGGESISDLRRAARAAPGANVEQTVGRLDELFGCELAGLAR